MTLPRVIFVDGLPGSGKSTTAQRLSLHLRRHGHAARWIFEHERDHPIFDESTARAVRENQPGADPALFARALEGYRRLAEHLTASPAETIILEGSLFQAAVGTQLLTETPDPEIDAFFDQTLDTLTPHRSTLIYLRAADTAAALNQTAANRGAWFPEFVVAHLAATPLGQREKIQTWPDALRVLTQHRITSDRLAKRFPGPTLIADPQAQTWATTNRQITSFLDLPPLEEPPISDETAAYAGRYQAEGVDETWEFRVASTGLELVGPPSARLWARPEGGFEIEGLAVEITFEDVTDGRAQSISCAPRLAQLPLCWHRV
ncbi:MAG: hypothetical protein ACN6I3_00290 [bacterium]